MFVTTIPRQFTFTKITFPRNLVNVEIEARNHARLLSNILFS
jgi:hypothetical protein